MTHTPTFSQNRIITPIVFGIAILFSVFLLKPTYASYIEKKSVISMLTQENMKLQSEYTMLKSIQDNIGSVVSQERLTRIEKLTKKYDNSEVISAVMLSNYTKNTPDKLAPIVINSVSVNA
jgi:hypothetical protein